MNEEKEEQMTFCDDCGIAVPVEVISMIEANDEVVYLCPDCFYNLTKEN